MKKHKRLTQTEKQMVALLTVHFEVEDIAKLTGMSIPSVYRIRQNSKDNMREVRQDYQALQEFLDQ